MKTLPLSLILMAVFTGCINYSRIGGTVDLPEDYLQSIPDSATLVMVNKENITADSLFKEVLQILYDRGHVIAVADKVGYYIATKPKLVGLATEQRMKLVIVDNLGFSQLTINADWRDEINAKDVDQYMTGMPIEEDWNHSWWGLHLPGVAFAECVAVANEVKDGKVIFR